jgi:hypothetical protein
MRINLFIISGSLINKHPVSPFYFSNQEYLTRRWWLPSNISSSWVNCDKNKWYFIFQKGTQIMIQTVKNQDITQSAILELLYPLFTILWISMPWSGNVVCFEVEGSGYSQKCEKAISFEKLIMFYNMSWCNMLRLVNIDLAIKHILFNFKQISCTGFFNEKFLKSKKPIRGNISQNFWLQGPILSCPIEFR